MAMLTPRSWLFVPGHRRDQVAKALDSRAEAIILDLEDAVPLEHKQAARQTVREALSRTREHACRCFVRINGGNATTWREDLMAIAGVNSGGVVLPKTESAGQVRELVGVLGGIGIVVMIESAKSLMNLPEIAGASETLIGLMLGAEDLVLSMGPYASLGGNVPDLSYARSVVAIAAAANGLQAIDRVCLDLEDNGLFAADCRAGCSLGFTGKAVIHPRQIAVVHEVMSPSEQDIAKARQVIEAFEASAGAATSVNHRLVDKPVVARAYELLRLVGHSREVGPHGR